MRSRRGGRVGLAVVVAASIGVGAAGCSGQPSESPSPSGSPDASPSGAPSGPESSARDVSLPPAGAAFDYQLGGAYDPPDGVEVVVRDSTEAPAPGIYSVCYVNGFQTQPGATWPQELVLRDESGAEVVDPGWPDERILDISTPAKREAIAERQGQAVADCAEAGYQAVEFDNLDAYSRSEGRLDLDDAVALASLLVERAHAEGLAAAQKNTAELEARGRDEIGYDFAVTEECDRYEECPDFAAVYGEHVLNIEYTEDLRGSAEEVCARAETPASTIIRDLELVPAGTAGYAYHAC